jgi:hypothetical protein
MSHRPTNTRVDSYCDHNPKPGDLVTHSAPSLGGLGIIICVHPWRLRSQRRVGIFWSVLPRIYAGQHIIFDSHSPVTRLLRLHR